MSPMRTECPACGKEVGALKNHVRLSSGNGHGPAGQVPDELDPNTTPEPNGQQASTPQRATNGNGKGTTGTPDQGGDRRDRVRNGSPNRLTVEAFDMEMTLPEAVEMIADMVERPEEFGIASEETARFLQERIEELETTQEILAANSESNLLEGDCPNCGGRLEEMGGTMMGIGGSPRIECTECGAVAHADEEPAK